jgi:mono/diheme cytochrome c family protein
MPSRRRFSLAMLGLAVLVLVPAALAGTRATAPKIVNVKATDLGFTLTPKTAPAGTVTFVVKNNGKLSHGFQIGIKKTALLKPGKTARLVVKFTKAGPVTYKSTVSTDKARGFKGTFKVTAAPAAGPGNAAAGKSVFVANCGTCHMLAAAGTHGTIGPNLDDEALAHAAIVAIVKAGKSGPQGAMPPFAGQLTPTQIDDVAAFIVANRR